MSSSKQLSDAAGSEVESLLLTMRTRACCSAGSTWSQLGSSASAAERVRPGMVPTHRPYTVTARAESKRPRPTHDDPKEQVSRAATRPPWIALLVRISSDLATAMPSYEGRGAGTGQSPVGASAPVSRRSRARNDANRTLTPPCPRGKARPSGWCLGRRRAPAAQLARSAVNRWAGLAFGRPGYSRRQRIASPSALPGSAPRWPGAWPGSARNRRGAALLSDPGRAPAFNRSEGRVSQLL